MRLARWQLVSGLRRGVVVTLFVAMNFAVGFPTKAEGTEHAPARLASGFTEVVITTRDADVWIETFTQVGGWEKREDRIASRAFLNFWGLEASAGGRIVLLANRGADRGYIRLVQLSNVAQSATRTDDRPWDTGGIFNFNVRVADMGAIRPKLHARGWIGESPPVRFSFGPFEVIEWIARGPDGVRVAFIERITPELEGWPHLKKMSRAFNSTTIVADMKKARSFFSNALGMTPYFERMGASPTAGPNVLGLPQNVAPLITRDVAILHPSGENDGSVELVHFMGAGGADLSKRARPTNLGIAALRFPVRNLQAALQVLSAHGVKPTSDPAEIDLYPYGRVLLAGIRGPDGNRLELYEVLAPRTSDSSSERNLKD